MRLIREKTEFALDGACAVAIGKFDGIHRGHQQLLRKILEQKERGLRAVVFTFDPPPGIFFGTGEGKGLTTREEKRRIFQRLGIDVLIEYPLNDQSAAMPPDTFIRRVLVGQLRTAYVAAGVDITFGAGGAGDAAMLLEYGRELGFSVQIIDKICQDGVEISSSLIREELCRGNMERVASLIGFPYSVTGTVVQGRHLGRTIGMPTVNLLPPADKLLPPRGVYFSSVSYSGKHYKSISNIGFKPTVSQEEIMGLETYLYDFDEELYGREITVKLLKFQRPEKKFASVEQLCAQMQRDIREGRHMGP